MHLKTTCVVIFFSFNTYILCQNLSHTYSQWSIWYSFYSILVIYQLVITLYFILHIWILSNDSYVFHLASFPPAICTWTHELLQPNIDEKHIIEKEGSSTKCTVYSSCCMMIMTKFHFHCGYCDKHRDVLIHINKALPLKWKHLVQGPVTWKTKTVKICPK